MLILGSDGNTQQEGQPKTVSETRSLDNPEWTKCWWTHCGAWHQSRSAPGSLGRTRRGFLLSFSFLWILRRHSMQDASPAFPTSPFLWDTIHLYPSRVLADAEFLLFLLPSLFPSPTLSFQNPSECSNHYFQLSLLPHAAFRNSLCCSATRRSSRWKSIQLPPLSQELSQLQRHVSPTINSLACFASTDCSCIEIPWASPHALPGWLFMLFIFDPLSVETSHALDIVTPKLKAMSWPLQNILWLVWLNPDENV